MTVTPESCPVCGAAVPAGAHACQECGADERTGWDEAKTRYDGLNLPDSAFDDDAPRRPATGQTPSIFWWVVAVGLLLLLTLGWIWR
jgi:hypothetical protein